MKVLIPAELDSQRRLDRRLCLALAVLLTLAWLAAGIQLVFSSPIRSGTDESINYVAFSAVHKRWATEQDFENYGINFFYYPPLYFLLFTPWPASPDLLKDPALTANWYDENYQYAGGNVMVNPAVASSASTELLTLYRVSRMVSLFLGLVVVASLTLSLHVLRLWHEAPYVSLLLLVSLLCLPQFLYYSTLCNNDNLLNALAAIATLGLTLHLTRPANSNPHWWQDRWLYVLAVLTGLALLTKQQGVLLLLYLPFGIWYSVRRDAISRSHLFLRVAKLVLIVGGLVVAFGGWWYLRLLMTGDVFGLKAARLAHDWAFLDKPLWEMWGWQRMLVTTWRTTYGLFTGPMHGLPDGVFAGYAILTAALLIIAALGFIRRSGPRQLARPGFLIACLAVFIAMNALLVIVNCNSVLAPYGRLLFPSLVPMSLLLAIGIGQLTAGNMGPFRRWPVVVCWVYIGLMTISLQARVFPAVRQSPEYLHPIVHPGAQAFPMPEPASDVVLIQPIQIPAGELRALRIHVLRDMGLNFGGGVRAALIVGDTQHRLPLTSYSTTDGTEKWLRIPFPTGLLLESATEAVLLVEGTRARAIFSSLEPRFMVSEHRSARNAGRLQVNGKTSDLALRVTLEFSAPLLLETPSIDP